MTLVEPETFTHTDLDPVLSVGDQDHDKFHHIVFGNNNTVAMAALTGVPVRALCGKLWVPTDDPSKFKKCPTCLERAEEMGWKVP